MVRFKVPQYSIKSRFISVSFKQILYKEFQVFYLSRRFCFTKIRVFIFVRQIFQCKMNPKTVITFNNCMKSSGNINLVPKHIMT